MQTKMAPISILRIPVQLSPVDRPLKGDYPSPCPGAKQRERGRTRERASMQRIGSARGFREALGTDRASLSLLDL